MLNKKDLRNLIEATTLLAIKLTRVVIEKDYYVTQYLIRYALRSEFSL